MNSFWVGSFCFSFVLLWDSRSAGSASGQQLLVPVPITDPSLSVEDQVLEWISALYLSEAEEIIDQDTEHQASWLVSIMKMSVFPLTSPGRLGASCEAVSSGGQPSGIPQFHMHKGETSVSLSLAVCGKSLPTFISGEQNPHSPCLLPHQRLAGLLFPLHSSLLFLSYCWFCMYLTHLWNHTIIL